MTSFNPIALRYFEKLALASTAMPLGDDAEEDQSHLPMISGSIVGRDNQSFLSKGERMMKAHIAATLALGTHLTVPAKAEEAAAAPVLNVEDLIQSLDEARPDGGDISIKELFELLEKQGIKVNTETAVPSTVCGGTGGGGW